MTCEIIIVKYGLPELEAECVASVQAHTDDVDHTLTVHDNYDADESLAKVWNDLIRESEAEYICLLNNDTLVQEKWLSNMLECFEDDDKLGGIGPVTNHASGAQGNAKWRTKSKRVMSVRGPLVGFCLVFPRCLWEDIGGFDEGYEIYGEDSDFCMEILKRGYKLVIRTDVFIYHHGKASTPIALARGKDIPRLQRESKERYAKKWRKNKPAPEPKKSRIVGKKIAKGKKAFQGPSQPIQIDSKPEPKSPFKPRVLSRAERLKEKQRIEVQFAQKMNPNQAKLLHELRKGKK